MHPTFTFKARIRKKNIHFDTMKKYGVFRKTKRKERKRIWKKFSTMKKHQTIVVCRRKSTSGWKKVLYKGTDTSYCYKVTLSSRSNLTHTNSNLIYLVPKHFKKFFFVIFVRYNLSKTLGGNLHCNQNYRKRAFSIEKLISSRKIIRQNQVCFVLISRVLNSIGEISRKKNAK